jgi:PPM family protein phosphatase
MATPTNAPSTFDQEVRASTRASEVCRLKHLRTLRSTALFCVGNPVVSRTDQAAATHVGGRLNNEDAYWLAPEIGLYVVADGLGGYQGGEVASRVATQALAELVAQKRDEIALNPPSMEDERLAVWSDVLAQGIRRAHQKILEGQVGELSMMGSTLAALFMPNNVALIAHVGDSRIYLYRAGELRQLTRDHTLDQEVVARGVDVSEDLHALFRNELTRALGIEGTAEPEINPVPVRQSDIFLLCTDGLYNALAADQIAAVLQSGTAQEICERLVREANQRDAVDNITALVVRVIEIDPSAAS